MPARERSEAHSGPLALTSELRAELGLGGEESLHVVAAGSRTVILERATDAPGRTDAPEGCDLALVADVGVFPLADLLGLVHSAGRSGLLAFHQADHAKSVYFRAGEVVFAASNQRVDRIGSCLVRSRAISLEQLRDAERHFSPRDRFGKVLVERGFLTPGELWNGVKFQVEEVVRSLFSYASGTVYFWEGDVHPDNVVRLSLPTRRLVSEGLERREELMRLLAVLEDPRVRLETVEARAGSLAGVERRLFDVLGEEPSFPAVCQRLGLDPLAGARTVHLLRQVGALRMHRGQAAARETGPSQVSRQEEEALRECVADYVKLLGELAVPLVAVEGANPVRERFVRVLADLAQRFPGFLRGVEPGHAGMLDPEDLIHRALALPQAREEQIRGALGELAAYLEFELKNHPRIEDADRFLEAVEPLRARLAV